MRTTFSYRLVAAVAGAAIAVGVPAAVCRPGAASVGLSAAGAAAQGTVAQEAVDVAAQAATVRYWTPARMIADQRAANGGPPSAVLPLSQTRRLVKNVRPAVPVRNTALARNKGLARNTGSAAPEPRPSLDTAGDGLAWTHGGAVAAAVGKIFFTLANEDYVCSGTLVRGKRVDVVLTAAHCVTSGPGRVSAARSHAVLSNTGLSNTGLSNTGPANTGPANTGPAGTGRWATNWMFVPGFRDGLEPYGEYTALRFFVTSDWTGPQGGTEQYDVAFVQVAAATRYGGAGAAEPPGLPVEFTSRQDSAPLRRAFVFGYPAEPPYSGLNLSYCAGPSAASGGSVRTACGMTAGDSGGPWLAGFGPRSGTVVAVSTYKVSGDLRVLYGAVLGPRARAIYEQAVSSAH